MSMFFSPSPAEVILTSYNMAVSCAGSGLIRPLVVHATPHVPELQGVVEHTLGSQMIDLEIKLPLLQILNSNVELMLSDNNNALLLEGQIFSD